MGFVHLWKRQHELAIEELERVIALDPNGADGHAGLAEVLTWVGRDEEAIGRVKKAMRLNPHYPVWYLVILGWAYTVMEQFDEAIETLERARIRDPDLLSTHIILATVYSRTERMNEARAEVEEIMRISPDFSLDLLRERVPFIDQATFEASVEALRKAGLS